MFIEVNILRHVVKDLTIEIESLKKELAELKMAFSMHVKLPENNHSSEDK